MEKMIDAKHQISLKQPSLSRDILFCLFIIKNYDLFHSKMIQDKFKFLPMSSTAVTTKQKLIYKVIFWLPR